ncbi:MAG: hypothetical protein ABIH37_04895 [archaeon]
MVKIKKENIIVKPEDIQPTSEHLKVIGTCNPAAIRDKNNDIVLFVRVIEQLKKIKDNHHYYSPRFTGKNKCNLSIDQFRKDSVDSYSDFDVIFKDGTKRLTFISHLRKVVLDSTGFKVKSIDKTPSFFGTANNGELGVEDPRITKINDLYYMTYVSLSMQENISTSLAVSKDLIKWKRKGIIFGEQDKDVVLFPEKIDNNYVSFDRPESGFRFTPPHIWINYSKDLVSWGKMKSLGLSKRGEWDYDRSGAGPPPIRTDKGWLFIYHAVLEPKRKAITQYIIERMEIEDSISGKLDLDYSIYCAGAALLDLKDPSKIIAKSDIPILFPLKKHEIGGYEAKRVIFPTGLVVDENKNDILLFSGGGDRVTTIKKVSLNKIMNKLNLSQK